jgi:hypothetical protein
LRFRLRRRFGRRRFRLGLRFRFGFRFGLDFGLRLRLGFRLRFGFGFRFRLRLGLRFRLGFRFRLGLRFGGSLRFLRRGRRRRYFTLGRPPVLNNFNGNGGSALAHTQALGGGFGKIYNAAFRSGNPGGYGNNGLLAILLVGYPELGTQGKTRMSGRKTGSCQLMRGRS